MLCLWFIFVLTLNAVSYVNMRIAIVAGEASGDILGSRLITAMLQHNPELIFEGIAGAEMTAVGCNVLYPMEKLAVMGFSEILPRLRELLSIRKNDEQMIVKN